MDGRISSGEDLELVYNDMELDGMADNMPDDDVINFNMDDHNNNDDDDDDDEGFTTSDDDLQDLTNQATIRTEKRGRPAGYRKYPEEDPAVEEHVLKKVKKDIMPLHALAVYMCCSCLCLAEVPMEVMAAARDKFTNLKIHERSQWILDWIATHTRRPDNTTVYLLSGYKVCRSAWLKCLGIPYSTFYGVWSMFINGAKQLVGPGNKTGKVQAETQYALSWLQNMSRRYADKMPDSDKLHLPCCLKKKDVYNMMCVEAEVYGEQIISMTHFLRVWRRYLPHIIIPKRSRFTSCDVCTKIKDQIEKAQGREAKKSLFKLREIHLHQQNLERQKYYKHAQKAKSSGSRYLSIILDDQDKTALPHLNNMAKGLSSLWRLKVSLMGAIVHGQGAYGFFDVCQWAHGSSFAVSDTCLASWLHWLECGIFEKIKVSFLMVGHTHEDIDQLFSRFSTWLSSREVKTLDGLIDGFQRCYTPNPTGIKLEEVYNIGEYLDLNNIKNHSRPHVFKIIKECGKAVMYTKKWSTDKAWTKCEGDFLLKKTPDGPIDLIRPSIDRIEDKVITDIQTFASFYRDQEMMQYWDSYFQELREIDESWDSPRRDIIQELLTMKRIVLEEDISDDFASLLNLPNVHEPIPPVQIGKKKNNGQAKEQEIREGFFVLLDWAKYADEWPQVAKVLQLVSPTEVEIHWYKGAKTTAWTPASRRVVGERGGKREPFVETVNTSVIWFKEFTLTPSGNLPKHVRQSIDSYFE